MIFRRMLFLELDDLIWFLLFNGISTLRGLFNVKTTLVEGQLWYYLTYSWRDKKVFPFYLFICPKVNVIAQVGFELAYNHDVVLYVNYIALGILILPHTFSFLNFFPRPSEPAARAPTTTGIAIIFIIIIYLLIESILYQRLLMVFHSSLRDSKTPQVPRTLLSILADLNNVLVWMVSNRPVISKSSSFCINPLVTVKRAPITIGMIVTFMFHSLFFFVFFNSQARSWYLSFSWLSFNFTLWSAGTAKSTILQVLFFSW